MVYRRAGTPGTHIGSSIDKLTDETGKLDVSDETSASAGAGDGNGLQVRKEDREEGEQVPKEAAQCIWLARVKPEECENIVRYTVLKGKVVKPEKQLRGGFDRSRGLTSW